MRVAAPSGSAAVEPVAAAVGDSAFAGAAELAPLLLALLTRSLLLLVSQLSGLPLTLWLADILLRGTIGGLHIFAARTIGSLSAFALRPLHDGVLLRCTTTLTSLKLALLSKNRLPLRLRLLRLSGTCHVPGRHPFVALFLAGFPLLATNNRPSLILRVLRLLANLSPHRLRPLRVGDPHIAVVDLPLLDPPRDLLRLRYILLRHLRRNDPQSISLHLVAQFSLPQLRR